MNGQINDFTFSESVTSEEGPEFLKATVFAGSKQGQVFF